MIFARNMKIPYYVFSINISSGNLIKWCTLYVLSNSNRCKRKNQPIKAYPYPNSQHFHIATIKQTEKGPVAFCSINLANHTLILDKNKAIIAMSSTETIPTSSEDALSKLNVPLEKLLRRPSSFLSEAMVAAKSTVPKDVLQFQ